MMQGIDIAEPFGIGQSGNFCRNFYSFPLLNIYRHTMNRIVVKPQRMQLTRCAVCADEMPDFAMSDIVPIIEEALFVI